MIDPAILRSLIETYQKYGWEFRRLVAVDSEAAAGVSDLGVPLSIGVTNAAWFSRPPQSGPVAWEIRYLGGAHYALVEHLEENSADFEQKLHEIEQRLADAVAERGKA
jgi:hypothetical protein